MSTTTATRRRQRLVVVDELALALVTVAAILGMHRLFVGSSYRGPLIAQALVAHLVVTLLRRANVRLLPAALITTVAAVLVISWARFPETTQWLLPSGETFRRAVEDLDDAWRLFGRVRAPAPVVNGFLAATAAAIWAIVFVADWAAFRVSATFEALLPATTLFVFAAALGRTGSPVAAAAAFATAALLFILLHRTSNQERTSRWSDAHHGQGRWSLLGTGAGLSLMALVGGIVAGVTVAGAGASALLPWRELNRNRPPRIVASPMVSLQTQLVDQPKAELFTVTSDEPSYWRLTSLDFFDGLIWRQSFSTSTAKGRLPREIDGAAKVDSVEQRFEIRQLGLVWLPAAYEPVAVDTGDHPADYDKRSSTLMVDRDIINSNGYTYGVTSALPQWSADDLRAASTDVPGKIRDRYDQLPDTVPESVRRLARQVTANATTPYDKALALQNYLRSDLFHYDINIGPGHSNNALANFLFRTRTGYCEQFAGAYAVMARVVNLPTRVAIGFTWGVRDPNHPTTYRVRGNHAHAWPEVYIGQYGWVPMEPTPGRAPPGAQNWLGMNPHQDDSDGGEATIPTTPSTAADPNANAGDVGQTDERDPKLNQDFGTGDSTAGGDESPVRQAAERAALPVAAALAAYLVLVPCALGVQRLVRRRRASTPSARVALSWQTATERARRAGLALPTWMTISEVADRLVAELPTSATGVRHLAHSMEMITYAEVPPAPEDVDVAQRASAEVVAEARRTESWWRRIATHFDIRRLWVRRAGRLVTTQGPR
jgi:transglutaminase-like putative cysteine protease